LAFAGLSKKKAAVVVCCAWVCVKVDTNNRNEETHFLFIAVIAVTSKGWCPIPALLMIAQAQKPGAIPTKAAYSLGRPTRAEYQHRRKNS